MGKSLKEYVPAIFRWWWVLVVFMIGDIAGIALTMWRNIEVPFWCWILLFLIGFVIAQFLAFHDVRIKRDEAIIKLHEIEKSRPEIVFKKSGEWQFYTSGKETYRALQIWFVNNPEIASESSVAKDVSGIITFYDIGMKSKFEIYGCFTVAEVPDYATIKDLKDKIDIWSPNDIPQKLLIALKYPGDKNAYGYAKSNFLATQDGREPDKEIKKGEHYIKVTFKGIGIVQKTIWFILINPGKEGDLSISSPINTPDLNKEGFKNL